MRIALAIFIVVALSGCATSRTATQSTAPTGPRWIAEFDTNALPLAITPVPFIAARVAAPKLTSIVGSVPMTVNASVVWQGSESAVGYFLYVGQSPGCYTYQFPCGHELGRILTGLSYGQKIFIAATAFDADGIESDFSEEVTYRPPALFRLPVGAIQCSADLQSWQSCTNATPIATNADGSVYFTVPIDEGIPAQFYRSL